MRKIIIGLVAALIATAAYAATVSYTTIQAPEGQTDTLLVTWTPLLNGDTGQSVAMSTYADRTVQFTGTFGSGGSVQLEGSNDGVNYDILTDPTGTTIVKVVQDSSTVSENSRFIRPRVTSGDGTTSITVTVLGKRP